MKKIIIGLLVGAVVSCGAVIAGDMADTYRYRYAAELSTEQMNIEGSAEYEAYRVTMRNLEAAADITRIAAYIYTGGLVVYAIHEFIKNKEK